MLSEKEFKYRWDRLSSYQRKFCLEYVKCFDVKEAATRAGYTGVMLASPLFRVYRKVKDVCDYLIQKNDLINSIVKPEWVLNEFKKLYENSASEITKTNILDKLSKILQLQSEAAKVEVNNNIPSVPVQITFTKEEGKNE